MEDEATPPRREQQFRSTNSSNWRVKDDLPRVANPPRRNVNRQDGEGRTYPNSPPPHRSNNTSAETGDADPGNRLYIGNLLYTAQKTDIENLFTSNGFNPINVSISVDPFTGRNPSYCFVDVDSPEEAQRAIEVLNGLDVLGRGVRVSPGVARKGRAEGRVKDYQGGGWGRSERRDAPTDYKPSFDRWNRSDAPSHFTAPVTEGRRLYVGSLPRIEPHSTLEEEIQALFSSHTSITPAAVSKLISPHPSKTSEPGNHYYCFVDLENKDDVEAAIAAVDGKPGSWGGAIRVNRAREQRDGGRERKVNRDQTSRGGYGGGGGRWRDQTQDNNQDQ